MKAGKYRDMSIAELEETLNELRTEMFNLRVQNTTKELQDTSQIKQVRRDIARALTVLDQKKAQEAA